MVPIILSSDKKQLSVFSGDKTAYPVYLTIGNIPKSIRRKPSQHVQILLAYLPTDSLDGAELSEDAARVARARLFHYVMSIVMESLKTATREGLEMTSGDGAIRHCFPIPACYVADYPRTTSRNVCSLWESLPDLQSMLGGPGTQQAVRSMGVTDSAGVAQDNEACDTVTIRSQDRGHSAASRAK